MRYIRYKCNLNPNIVRIQDFKQTVKSKINDLTFSIKEIIL